MQATELKAGDRVKYISELGDNSKSDKYAEGVVDRIDSYDNGLVWLLVGEKGYEKSHAFNPSWITEVIKAAPTKTQIDVIERKFAQLAGLTVEHHLGATCSETTLLKIQVRLLCAEIVKLQQEAK